MDQEIFLISFYTTTDEIGQQVKNKMKRSVFAKIKNVGQKEFFEASINKMKVSKKLQMYSFEYENETMALVDNKLYSIYRTYTVGDMIELYLEDKGGVY